MKDIIENVIDSIDLVSQFRPEDKEGLELLDKFKARVLTYDPDKLTEKLIERGIIEDNESKHSARFDFELRMLKNIVRLIMNDYKAILKGDTPIEKGYQLLKIPKQAWLKNESLLSKFKKEVFSNYDLIIDQSDVDTLIRKIVLCEEVSLFENSGINIAIPVLAKYREDNLLKLSDIIDIGDESKTSINLKPGAYAVTGGPSAGKSLFINDIENYIRERSYKVIALEPGYKGEASITLESVGEELSNAFGSNKDIILIDSFRFSSVLLKSIALKNGISAAAFAIATTLTIVAERTGKIVLFVISSETDEKEINTIFFQRLIGACSGVFAPQYGTYAGIASIRDSDRRPFPYTLKGKEANVQDNLVNAFDYVNYSRELYNSIGGVKMIK